MQTNLRWIIASLAIGSIATLHAERVSVDATVSAATLYTNQADILSTATVTLSTAGQHQLLVETSQAYIDELSVDIDGAQLLGYSIIADDKLQSSEQSDALEQARQQLKILEREISDNTNLHSALLARLETADTDIDDIMDRITSLKSDYQNLVEQKSAIEEEIARLEKLKNWHDNNFPPQQRVDLQEPAQRDLQKILVIDINAEQAGEITLALREKSGDAYWQPTSQWHLDSKTGEIDIIGQAKIYQRTGDDWQDVALMLAVMPLQYYFMPAFDEQTVSFSADKSSKLNPASSYSMAEPVAEYAADELVMKQAAPQPVIVGKGGNFQVTMPNTYSLSSGGDSHLLTYYHEQVQADSMFSAFYGWDWPQEVLLIAQWTQPGDMPLLAGHMKLLRDDLHLVSYNPDEIMLPGSEWSLSFGVDARFDAESILPPEYKEENGFIRRDKMVKKEETYRLTNLAEETLPVRIYARLPVSTEEGIEIKPIWSPKPDELDVDGVKGIVYWTKELAPEEVLSVEHGYEIRHPEDKSITTSQ